MDAEPDYDTTNLQQLREDLERLNVAAVKGGFGPSARAVRTRPAEKVASEQVKTSKPRRKQTVAEPTAPLETATAPARAKRAKGGGAAAKTEAPVTSSPKRGKAGSAKTAEAPGASKKAGAAKKAKAPPETGSRRANTPLADKGKAGARRLLRLLRRDEDDTSPVVPGTDFTESGVVRLLAHLRTPRTRRNRFLQRLHRLLTQPVSMGTQTRAGVSVERLQRVARQLLEIEENGWHYFQAVRAARRGSQTSDTTAIALPAPEAATPGMA